MSRGVAFGKSNRGCDVAKLLVLIEQPIRAEVPSFRGHFAEFDKKSKPAPPS
jgi:hypothetical protein